MTQEAEIYFDNCDLTDNAGGLEHSPNFDERLNGLKSIWRAVITQALIDAASNSKKRENLKAKREAKTWLLGESEDFFDICCLADLNPSYVKKKAKLALARNCVWRNDKKKQNLEAMEKAELKIAV